MPEPMMSAPSNSGSTAKVVGLLIALVLLGAVVYLIMSKSSDPGTKSGTGAPTAQNSQSNPTPPPVAERYAYTGEVVRVQGSVVTVKATGTLNGLSEDLTLSVKTEASTTFTLQVINRTTNAITQETFKLASLKAGDQVTVFSATNIANKTEFTASKILATELK